MPEWGSEQAQEFIYLASLFMRKRFTLGPMVREDTEPIRIYAGLKSINGYIDMDVICGETDTIGDSANLDELSKWLPLVDNILPTLKDKFILAVRFYHQAIEIIETATDMAYINLVSSIETLCQDLSTETKKLEEIDQGLAAAIKKISSCDLRKDIEKRILKREPFIQNKFVNFIKNNIDASFWTYNKRPQHGRIEPVDLDRILKNIYQQRSNFLHSGTPFPEYIYLTDRMPDISHLKYDQAYIMHRLYQEEIPVGLGITSGSRSWQPSEYIPYPHFFERLVRHVLLNYLKRNQQNEDAQ